jgi:LmbE family N-acetylglucosaminyl deacetylase
VTPLLQRVRGPVRSYRRRAEAGVQRAWRRALVARSREGTEESEKRSCLVLAAHPDDETFACGGTILHKTAAGTPVKVFIATDGRNANPSSSVLSAEQLGTIRRAEAVEACGILGVRREDLVQLANPHLRTTEWLDDARSRVEKLIRDFRPDEILVNSALDYHPDHRAMNGLVRDLVSRRLFTGHVAEYPIWYLYDGPWSSDMASLAGRPTVDSSTVVSSSRLSLVWERVWAPIASVARLRPVAVSVGAHLERKREAIVAYRSQVTNLTGEDTWGYLGEDFVSLFLQPHELYFPLATT